MTEIRPVAYGSKAYEATVELRREILRRPLGLDFTEAQLAAEKDDVHFAFLYADDVLACLILTAAPPLHSEGEEVGGEGQDDPWPKDPTPNDPTTLRMRQVAVRQELQGQGVGRQLVETSEAWTRAHGYQKMVLHAREAAVPFYLRLGYVLEGEPFEEVGLPHRAMSKKL